MARTRRTATASNAANVASTSAQPVIPPQKKSRRKPTASKGKQKVITIDTAAAQIEGNQNLATESRADYLQKTKFIAKCLKEKDLQKLVNNPRKVIDYINNRYTNKNSRRSYLTAWNSLLKHTTLEISDANQQLFFDAMMKAANEADDAAKDNAPKVAEVMLNGKRVTWRDVLECEKRLRKDEYASRDHLLIAMNSLRPPRRLKDYCDMEVCKNKSEFDRSTYHNKMYLDTRNKFAQMTIGEYKTAKTYGDYEAKISGTLYDIIKCSLNEEKRKYLFENAKHEPFTAGTFSKYVTDVIKRTMKCSIGQTGLRHLKITDFNASNPSQREREQLARDMGNSPEMQGYYNIASTPEERAAKQGKIDHNLAEIKRLREVINKALTKIDELSREITEL